MNMRIVQPAKQIGLTSTTQGNITLRWHFGINLPIQKCVRMCGEGTRSYIIITQSIDHFDIHFVDIKFGRYNTNISRYLHVKIF
jgi:hypothetical protein